MAKILIVEDDKQVSKACRDWLTNEGHEVEVTEDGADALQLLRSFAFEVVILDWNLPAMSGPEILRRFRAEGGHTQVIFLTGKSDFESRAAGLDAGADDYVTKPVDMGELSARIRSRLRRPGQFAPLNVTIGGVQVDTNSREVLVDSKRVHFTTREYTVLEFLIRHRGVAFSSKALRDQIWPTDSAVLEDTIRVCMQSIRKKLGPTHSSLIQTIAGSGYIIPKEQ